MRHAEGAVDIVAQARAVVPLVCAADGREVATVARAEDARQRVAVQGCGDRGCDGFGDRRAGTKGGHDALERGRRLETMARGMQQMWVVCRAGVFDEQQHGALQVALHA